MPLDKLIVFQGKGTMTGDATEEKLPDVEYIEGSSFEGIMNSLKQGNALAVLPIWNSHLGEIKQTKIIEYLFEEGFIVHAIWPHWVDFACIVKKGTSIEDIQRIISFVVARVQCSDFIKEINADFDEGGSTSTKDAHKKFTEGNNWDAVLCNADLSNGTQEVIRRNVSNKLNFTTFVLLGKITEDEWVDTKWDKLKLHILPKNYQITGIEMPAIEGSLSDAQHDLFGYFLQDISNIDEIPKIIFASEKEYAKVRLVLEYKKSSSQPHFPDVDLESDILIVDALGTTKSFYSDEVYKFIPSRYSSFPSKHFAKHLGTQTCFYSCPPLNILVHGFDEEIVEIIARESIAHHFRAIQQGANCTPEQKDFFEIYKIRYQEYGTGFPEFEEL